MRSAIIATSIALGVILAGCTGKSQQSSAPATSAPTPTALTNPTDFPLTAGSTILDVKPFSQVIAIHTGGSMLADQGSGTYAGYEVLAGSTQTAAALRTWLTQLGQHPPTGYEYQTGSATSTGHVAQTLALYGIAYAAFRTQKKTPAHGVVVVAMDPKQVKEKLGIALDLVERYRSLPSAVRDPIDQQFKGRTGFTISEATDPSSPLGMTIAALRELQSSDQRAIVMIDGTKQ
jgi:hypothetical protein